MNRLLLSSASFILVLAGPASAAALQPHRAYYDLTAKRIEAGNGISTIIGKLAYEITGAECDGYAVNYRNASRISYNEGTTQVVDNQLTSWESADGLSFDTTLREYVDSKLNSDTRITVKKDANDLPGKGLLTASATKEFSTSPSAIFPSRYQIKLIDEALKGAARDVSLVYEGSDGEKSLRAITFIGARKPAAGLPDKDAAALASTQAWPISVSYYSESAKDDEQPVYQASFLMLENGITTDLVLDYGTYAMSGKLTKLELLTPGTCK